jgi:hypothetical protein
MSPFPEHKLLRNVKPPHLLHLGLLGLLGLERSRDRQQTNTNSGGPPWWLSTCNKSWGTGEKEDLVEVQEVDDDETSHHGFMEGSYSRPFSDQALL